MSRIYLVTGAAGFLGSNICAQLLEKGEKVRALVLPNDKSGCVPSDPPSVPSFVECLHGGECRQRHRKQQSERLDAAGTEVFITPAVPVIVRSKI